MPQGSIIGPILFLCYINDIAGIALKNGIQISLYADDAVIYLTSADATVMQSKLQSALNDITEWCRRNHIKLNTKKTKLCCYGTRHKLKNYQIDCDLYGTRLMVSKQYTYLGVILDETLSLSSNFNNLFKKFSYKLFQFTKIRKYLPPDIRLIVYKQAILLLVEYVSYLLYLNRKHDVDKLQKLQNKALRLCFDIIDPRAISVCHLHVQANLLTLEHRREKQLLGLMFDVSKKEEYIKRNLIQTRQADKVTLISEIIRCGIYAKSPYKVGCSLWHELDVNIQTIDQKSVYKSQLKDLYGLPKKPNT